MLNNWRRHGADKDYPATTQIDPYASGVLFEGWARPYPFIPPESFVPLGTLRPQTWMLEHGWRMYGAIDPREVPGPIA
ncbi:MAG TPA: hypothetical protein VM261_28885 [Kofleriaceae bacterium]|nr:hypothetical protein [Kofleriaceae bacterium]